MPGEVQLPVAPLPVPRPGAPRRADRASTRRRGCSWTARRRPRRAGTLDDDEALAAVAVICRRLDGIPLALELAAARLTQPDARRAGRPGAGPVRGADLRQPHRRGPAADPARDGGLEPRPAHRAASGCCSAGWRSSAAGWTLAAAEAGRQPGRRAFQPGGGAGAAGAARSAVPGGRRPVRRPHPVPHAGDAAAVRRRQARRRRRARTLVAAAHAAFFLALGEQAETGSAWAIAGAMGAGRCGGTREPAGGAGLVDGDRRAG